MKPDTVLLVTHSGDHFTIDRVAAAIARRGVPWFRLDTDRFPATVKLVAHLSSAGPEVLLSDGAQQLPLARVRAVWNRRIWPPQLSQPLRVDAEITSHSRMPSAPHLRLALNREILDGASAPPAVPLNRASQICSTADRELCEVTPTSTLTPEHQEICRRESHATLQGVLRGLTGVVQVNDLTRTAAAEDKLLQLRLAAELGLPIPRTLLTNDPAALQQLFEQTGGQVVCKLLRPVSLSMDGAGAVVRTNRVTRQDLEQSDGLGYCPMVFQELIPKATELRVVVVGAQLFAGCLDASTSRNGTIDWRNAAPGEVAWQPGQVSAATADRLRAMLRRLGLCFAAADLIRTPDGQEYFLELNPSGEWGMLEHDLELPIAEAITRLLLEEGDKHQ